MTKQEYNTFLELGIINGIGGAGNNIEPQLKIILSSLPGYNKNKAESLLSDIRLIAGEHDIMYYYKMGFYSANLHFVYQLYNLLTWTNWKKIFVCFSVFLLLNKFGKVFYFGKK